MPKQYKAEIKIYTGTNTPIATLREIKIPKSEDWRYGNLEELTVINNETLRLSLPNRRKLTGRMRQTPQGLDINFELKFPLSYQPALRNLVTLLSEHFGRVDYSTEGLLKSNPRAVIAG